MPLIKCPDCGKEHSDQAAACPECGRPHKPAVEAKNKTREKKKKGCLPGCLITLLGFIVLGAIIGIVEESKTDDAIRGCNDGKADSCAELLNDSSFKDYDKITNKDFAGKFAAKQAEAKRQSAKYARLYICEKALKESLKDPDSLRILNKDRDNLLIEYSATNTYGGRVRNVLDCNTGKNLR